MLLIIAWVVETSPVALPVLYFTHFRPRQQKAQLNRIHSLAKEFQAQVVTLLETIRPEVLRPQGLIIKKDPRQDPKVLYESLYHTMVTDYYEANALRPDLAPELREAQAQLQALTDERAERENRFRMEHPNEEQIRVQYNYLREEIRRVGSEILRGIRVAEKKIQVIECPRCGGPASEEAARCPYCGNEFSQVR
jgi:predicted nucleic-acid-binding Zn-ribbon protein